MKRITDLEIDLWQEDICREFADWSSVDRDAWEMPHELREDDTDVPSWWHNDASGLQDWK